MDDFMSCYCKTKMCIDGSVWVSETTKNISILIGFNRIIILSDQY